MKAKRKSKANSCDTARLTTIPVTTPAQANKAFLASLPPLKDGANEHRQEFLQVAEALLSMRTFSIFDAYNLSRFRNFDIIELQDLFDKWAQFMADASLIKIVVNSCYDQKTYYCPFAN